MHEAIILTNMLLEQYPRLLRSIAELHMACIEKDMLSSHFEATFDISKIESYWTLAMWELGREIILIHDKDKEGVAAVVMLNKPFIDTGSRNSTVANLLVDEKYRGMGMSRALTIQVENISKAARKTLVHLDVEMGSKAEAVFRKFGYSKTLTENDAEVAGGKLNSMMAHYRKDLNASDALVL